MYILFEGMPCTGKTTIAKRLAERLDAHYMKSVVSDTNFGNIIKQFRFSSPDTMDYFYLIDGLVDELRVRDLLKTKDVIRDKSHVASIAHLQIQGYASDNNQIHEAITMGYEQLSYYCIRPDFIIFIEPDLDEVKKHVSEKSDCSQIDNDVIANESIYIKQSDAIKNVLQNCYHSRIITIKAFSLNIEKTCEQIISLIQDRK